MLLDFGDGKRLEQWGQYRLIRPDPTAKGAPAKPALWKSASAVYRGPKGAGVWEKRTRLPDDWPVEFDDLRLSIKLAPYKHTGVFPEQQANWRWTREQARGRARSLNLLNLFAYTGGATIALAKDGHFITHVDASKPAIGWGKTNAALNAVPGDRIRWMLDDVPGFVAREQRRGKRYDGIILDPPAFGCAPSGKAWRLDRDLAPLLKACCTLLSPEPAFMVLNGYAQNDTPASFHRLLTETIRENTNLAAFKITAQELTLSTPAGRQLSTGIVARCAFGSVHRNG
ncbi:class I SAM-dependent methyltransferase [soil metagenome]